MGVNNILEIGRQGLAANRKALATTSNNIANANTPGYSRQKAVFIARDQDSTSGILVGGGVEIKKVIRVHDSFVEKRILDESKLYGSYKTRTEGLRRIESTVFNNGSHIGDLLNRFFNDYRELSLNPEISTTRASVLNSAQSAAEGFKRLSDSMEGAINDIDHQIEAVTVEINGLTKELAKLNDSILRLEVTGDSANELLDRRDEVAKNICQRLGAQILTTDEGHVNMIAPGVGALVVGSDSNELVTLRTPGHDGKKSGSIEIFLKDSLGGQHNVTSTIREGEVAGFLQVRDQVISPALKKLDKVAYSFMTEVNGLHRQGVGTDGQSGRNIFSDVQGEDGAARLIHISKDVLNAHENIAAAVEPNAPGDNRLALRMVELQNQEMISEKTAEGVESKKHTLNGAINNMVGDIAIKTQHDEGILKNQEAIMEQLHNYKQSVSGVSVEEEGINMIQFQTAFNASVKTMKMADELLQAVLSIKT